MKKTLILLLILIFPLTIIIPQICTATNTTFASTQQESINQEEIEESIEEEINNQLDNLDFSNLDDILNSFNENQSNLFNGKNFLEKVYQLLNGKYDDETSIFKSILNIFFDNFSSLLPVISLIIGTSLLGSMIQGIKPSSTDKSVSNIINFVTYGVVVILLLSIIARMISLTTNTISSIKGQMDSTFPILLTLLTAVGGTTSVSLYTPAMALLTNLIVSFFNYILLPIFIFSVIFSIISNLSNTVKLNKFTSFFNSSFKWLVGLVFTIFSAFMSIQGISAGSIDGISLRTAKYAIRSYVPVLGSYLSDGMSVILASSNLIKNVVGVAGLFMLIATILSPLIELILIMLALKLIAGIIEPLGNKQVANLASSLSKSVVLLIVLIIGISFAYFIMLGLVMCTANIF